MCGALVPRLATPRPTVPDISLEVHLSATVLGVEEEGE